MLLILLHYPSPLHFHYRLHSNSKEGMLLIVLLQSAPPLAVPLSWDMSTLNLPLDFCFNLNWKEGLVLILLLHSPPTLHFSYFLNSNSK